MPGAELESVWQSINLRKTGPEHNHSVGQAVTTPHSVRGPSAHGWQAWLLLSALLLVLGLAFQGTRGLWSPDEGRFTGGAVQMLDSGHWLVPRYSPDQPNLSKPPVTYWMIAAAVAVFGHDTWAVRLPYALAYVLTALLVGLIARSWMGDRAWLAALVYGLALGPFLTANIVSTDVPLTLFETLAMLGYVRAEFAGDAGVRGRWALLMWAGFGLAFLTKGPPGLLPLLAAIPYSVRRGGWRGFGRLCTLPGLALFLLIGGGWYLAVMLREPGAVHDFLYREVYERIFTATQQRNPQWYGGFVVYLPFLLLATLPWWLALGRMLRAARTAWRDGWTQSDPRALLWLWVLLPLVVFFLARSRLPLYVLPLLAPLALLLARELDARVDLSQRGPRVRLALWVLLLLALKGGLALGVHTRNDERALAVRLATAAVARPYAALMFVEDVGTAYQREQRTPWGLNLYLRRPVYAVAWRSAGDRVRLCGTLDARGALLVVADRGIATAVQSALRGCAARVEPLGTLYQARLLWATPAGGR